MSLLSFFKGLLRKNTTDDLSVEALRAEITALTGKLKRLYERNVELMGEVEKLKFEIQVYHGRSRA